MRTFCFLLIFSSCVHTHNPQPYDTIFKDELKNWELVYEHELKVAIENEDIAAFYFFWPEYLKEIEKRKLNSVIQK